MKKIYIAPDVREMQVEAADILTQSLLFSEQENDVIDQKDVHPFGSFFQ